MRKQVSVFPFMLYLFLFTFIEFSGQKTYSYIDVKRKYQKKEKHIKQFNFYEEITEI